MIVGHSFCTLLMDRATAGLKFTLCAVTIILRLCGRAKDATLSTTIALVDMVSEVVDGVLLPSVSSEFRPMGLLGFSRVDRVILVTKLVVLFLRRVGSFVLVTVFLILTLVSFFGNFFSPVGVSVMGTIIPGGREIGTGDLLSDISRAFLFTK